MPARSWGRLAIRVTWKKWLLCRQGSFVMGSNRYDDEKPQHKVNVAAFRIAKYPVTNQQYARFVAATGHEPPQHWRGKTPPRELNNHPVVNVSWHDARAYCEWLSTGAR